MLGRRENSNVIILLKVTLSIVFVVPALPGTYRVSQRKIEDAKGREATRNINSQGRSAAAYFGTCCSICQQSFFADRHISRSLAVVNALMAARCGASVGMGMLSLATRKAYST